MTSRIERLARFLRANGMAAGAGLMLAVLVVLAVRWIARNRDAPPPRKVMQFTMVSVQPQPPPPRTPPPPPPPQQPQKLDDAQPQAQAQRVELKAAEIPPPDAPPPTPGGGRLALAAEGAGPGDAFNLSGNPGGRGLLSGGGLGDGNGEGIGEGAGNRYAWYYAKLASEIEDAFRKSKRASTSQARVELRIWADATGRIERVQLIRSTGNAELDEAIRSITGMKLREPPPPDLPMPMIARFTARRPG